MKSATSGDSQQPRPLKLCNVTRNMEDLSDHVASLLTDMLKHTSVYLWNPPDSCLVTPCNYGFRELADEGRQIQSRLLDRYRHFSELVRILLRSQPEETLQTFKEADRVVTEVAELHTTWHKSTQEVLDSALQALKTTMSLLNRLYDPTSGEVVVVPDTNALLYHPHVERWGFPGVKKFTIVLLPSVLSELDALKISHRNEDVRRTAESLIRCVKDYRRRGSLGDGVPIVTDKVTLQAIAVEADVRGSLSWLDPDIEDDRFLASTIEVMRSRPRSTVVIVTRDINLQNKAEFAGVPFVEPPDVPTS